MSEPDKAVEALRARGFRLTPQRVMVISAVAEGGRHMGVDEVLQRARAKYPYMDVATVYRTLHLLKEIGIVTEVAIGDRLHYELTDPNGHHHHMVCRTCHGAFNLSPSYLEEFRQLLNKEFGFEPDLDNFAVSGVCSRCRAQEQEAHQ